MKLNAARRIAAQSVWAIFLCLSAALQAAPYAGNVIELEQPDGTPVQVRFWGDEFYVRGESLDGYTVIRDPANGWIVYAQLNGDASDFVPTEMVYDHRHPTDPNDPIFSPAGFQGQRGKGGQTGRGKGLMRRLSLRKDVVEARHLERRRQLHPEQFTASAAQEGADGIASTADIVSAPMAGSVVGLTLLVEFPDKRGTVSAAEIERFCNERGYTGFGNNGSVRDYFYDVSGGLLDYTNVVTDYVMLDNNKSYYDACGGWGKTGELIDEALGKLCARGFDFSALTRRSNGRVMSLNIFYAGSPACGWSEGLWPHMSTHNVTFCGVSFGTYQITGIGSSLRLGTFCHENGHMTLGYPDLYDYSYETNGAGNYCLMGYGGADTNPIPPCGYLRQQSGWETVIDITNDPAGTLRTHPANANLSYRYNNPANSSEYFLIESRLKSGRNSSLPAEGLLIWRINENGSNTQPTNHPTHPYRKFFRAAVEQADGQFHLERKSNYGDGNDTFRSGYRDTFDDFSSPDAKWWNDSFSGLSISRVGPVSSEMSFVVGGGFVPTAHYPLNMNGQDVSGNNYNAVAYNLPADGSYWVSPSFDGSYSDLGQAFRLSGQGEYVELPAAVGATNEIGIGFWMKPDLAANMVVLDKFVSNAGGAGWSVRLNADGRISFLVGSGGNYTAVTTRYPAYEAGRWIHVACSFKDGQGRIFVNGRLRALHENITQTPNAAGVKVRLGMGVQVNPDWVYKGAVDDVRFYDMELTEGRLKAVEGLDFKPGRGLMLYLPLDETAGTTATDKSGSDKNAGLQNGLSFNADSRAGVAESALDLDGTDDYLSVPAGFQKVHGGLTVSMWVYPTAVKNWARFIDFGNGSGADNIVFARYSNTNDLTFQVYNGRTDGGQIRASNVIELNKWQHFAATVTETGVAVIYKNGQAVASGTTGTALEVFRTSNYIGRSNWSTDAYYQGLLDEIRVHNYAMAGSEIDALYRDRRIDGPLPHNGADDASPNVILEWAVPLQGVRHDIYIGTSAAAVTTATRTSPEYKGRRFSPRYKPAGLDAWRDYFWRSDAVLSDGSVVAGPVWSFSTVGGLIRQVWTDIGGTSVSNLTGDAAYPDSPDITELVNGFEGPTDWSDNYGSRIFGLLCPPVSGQHTFWIASDDSSELWLSPVPNPSQMAKYASVSGATASREWTKFGSQQTQLLTVAAGNRYYVMALHKEGAGGDNLAVAWKGPSCPVRRVIDGFWLRPMTENEWPSFAVEGLPTIPAKEGMPLAYSLAGSAADPDNDALIYSKYSGPEWLTVAADGQLSGTPRDGDTGMNSFVIQVGDGKGGTDMAMLNIDVRDQYTGSRGAADILPFAGYWLSNGADNPADLTGSGQTDYSDWSMFTRNWQTDLSDGLISQWTMDDAEGLTVRDNAGRNDAVMVNMSPYARVQERLGGALQFDGVNDYVRVTGYAGITGTSARSVMAWIKSPGAGVNMVIASWGTVAPGQQYLFGVFGDGSVGVYSGGPSIKTTLSVLDNRWHHIAAVLPDDGSPSLGEVRLYIDGVQQSNTVTSSNQSINTTPGGDMSIGAMSAGPDQAVAFYKGLIDDVRVYDRVVSSEQMQTLSMQGLQVYLKFDEAFGTDAIDGSVYGRDGHLLNGPVWRSTAGVNDGALAFDGVDDYVNVDGYAGISGKTARTVSVWIKTPGTGANMGIASWGASAVGQQFLFGVFGDGGVGVYSAGPYIKTIQGVADDQWHHIAAVLPNDGSPSLSEIQLYIDGVRQTNTYLTSESALNTVAAEDLMIGAVSTGTGQAALFKGLIDELRIYDRALTAQAVADLMN